MFDNFEWFAWKIIVHCLGWLHTMTAVNVCGWLLKSHVCFTTVDIKGCSTPPRVILESCFIWFPSCFLWLPNVLSETLHPAPQKKTTWNPTTPSAPVIPCFSRCLSSPKPLTCRREAYWSIREFRGLEDDLSGNDFSGSSRSFFWVGKGAQLPTWTPKNSRHPKSLDPE